MASAEVPALLVDDIDDLDEYYEGASTRTSAAAAGASASASLKEATPVCLKAAKAQSHTHMHAKESEAQSPMGRMLKPGVFVRGTGFPKVPVGPAYRI